jgi:hypothetical protein
VATHGRTVAGEADLVAEVVSGRIEPPADIPGEIFAPALATVLKQRRLDMQGLAGELGISRATLYRRGGSRELLLGAVWWYLTKIAMTRAYQAAAEMSGPSRVVAVAELFMRDVSSRAPLRRFLAAEPEAALRVLASANGPVQAGIVAVYRRVIAEEREAGRLQTAVDDDTLAFAIVRIGEGFLYSDVIADREPEIDRAVSVYRELLRV